MTLILENRPNLGRNFVANQRDAELVGYAFLADQVGLYQIHPHPRIV